MFRFLNTLNPFALRRHIDRLAEANQRLAADAILQRTTRVFLGRVTSDVVSKMEEQALELEMTNDLLSDAVAMAKRYQGALVEAGTAIDAVNSPNGTTRKLGRIVSTALQGTEAAPLGELARG